MREPTGRLELTWTNKHLRLLAHEDDTYEWVDQADYRVAEVRLLHDHSTVGIVGNDRSHDNLLIRGDALHALRSLTELPEFSGQLAGGVRLCYIDPPFNTGQVFPHYDDGLEHSVWLTMIRDRLAQIRDLLAPNGSVWVHLDDTEVHRARSVMDEVFGPQNFIACFVWQKVDSPNDNKVAVTPDHDFLLCYAKSPGLESFKPMPSPSILEAYGQVGADGRRYRDRLLKKNGKNSLRSDRPTMFFGIRDPDGNMVYPVHEDGREACWSLGRSAVERQADEGLLIWKRRLSADLEQWVPYTREWAPALPTRPWPTIWSGMHTMRQAKAHLRQLFPGIDLFDTPKPEMLLQRIIEIATEPGDVVLDCFVGSGTTSAVAHKMGRRWIASDWRAETIATFTLPRLARVVAGQDAGGITSAVGWEGGGGFRVVDVAPSMYISVDSLVFLAEWTTNGALAEATAAQLGFAFDAKSRPFCGHKGRRRLAVIDGLVDANVVRLLIGELAEREQVVVAGTSIDPAARRELPKGSSLRKIPDALLQSYQRESRLADLVPRTRPPTAAGLLR